MPYTSLDETQLQLLTQGIIDINDEINSATYAYVREALMRLKGVGAPDTIVQITSPGGELEAALGIYDLLRLYPGKITGVVLGQAQSGGSVILQACRHRQCASNATILIHGVATYIRYDGVITPKQMKKTMDVFEKNLVLIDRVYRTRTKRSASAMRRQYHKEEAMSPEQALAFGLIDEII